MRYSTLIVPIALLAIPATANAAGCQPAFVGADQTVMVDGVDIGSLNSAVRDFSVRVQNKAGPSGQPGAMDAAPCGATIRITRVGASSNPDSPPYPLSAPGTGHIETLPDPASGGIATSAVVLATAPSGAPARTLPFQIRIPSTRGWQPRTT